MRKPFSRLYAALTLPRLSYIYKQDPVTSRVLERLLKNAFALAVDEYNEYTIRIKCFYYYRETPVIISWWTGNRNYAYAANGYIKNSYGEYIYKWGTCVPHADIVKWLQSIEDRFYYKVGMSLLHDPSFNGRPTTTK